MYLYVNLLIFLSLIKLTAGEARSFICLNDPNKYSMEFLHMTFKVFLYALRWKAILPFNTVLRICHIRIHYALAFYLFRLNVFNLDQIFN